MGVFNCNMALDAVYPVGSLYFTTAAVCPLETLGIGTWQKVGSNLTIAKSGNVAIKGNGAAIGVHSVGNATDKNLICAHSCASGGGYMIKAADNILQNTNCDTSSELRFTTNTAKSGLTGTASLSNLTVNIFQRTV